MKILIQAYNTYRQNAAGGVQTRITNLLSFFSHDRRKNIEVDLFNKWQTKVSDYDIIHFFKGSLDHYNLMSYCKSKHLKIVLSSIIPIEGALRIFFFLIISKLFKIPTVHFIIRKNLEMADLVLAQTEKERQFIHQNYKIPYNKIKVISNGISPYITMGNANEFRARFQIYDEFILSVGRIDRNKNQLNVIKALKGQNIKYIIIGGPDPEDKTKYFEHCKEVADNNVLFLGWIDAKDKVLANAYAAAKVVILSSFQEIYGNCIYEGLANDCLIACTNFLDISDKNLLPYVEWFDPSNISDIRKKVKALFYKEDKIDISNYVRENYSWEHITQQHIDVYESLLKQ